MRNVIVTGASRGLGFMISTALAAAGYRVIAIARHETAELRAAAAAASEAQRGALEFRAFDLAQIGPANPGAVRARGSCSRYRRRPRARGPAPASRRPAAGRSG